MKLYMQEKQGIAVENISPRAVLRLSLDTQLITDDEFTILY